MKLLVLSIILLSSAATATAQLADPTKWTFAAKSVSANTYEISITAVVRGPWRIYSQNTGKGGPIPTSITFKKNPALVFVGKTKETGNLQKA